MNEFAAQLTKVVRYAAAFGSSRVNDPVGFEIAHDGDALAAHTPRYAAADYLRERGRDEEADVLQHHEGSVFADSQGKVRPLPQQIHVEGRRWHQRTYGNTYHTVTVHVDGQPAITVPRTYGYGDHYLQTAADAIEQAGLLPPREQRPQGQSHEALWRWAERVGVPLTYDVQDVRRRSDL
jgi:hypothetical protein